MELLRRTYVDVVNSRRPGFASAIGRRAEEMPASEWPMTSADVRATGGAEDIAAEVELMLDAMWSKAENAARRQGLTRQMFGQMMKQSPDYESMHTMLDFECVALRNFKAFGSKTYYFSENLVERLAFTELNIGAELVVPPFRSCLFVFDDDTARRALLGVGDGRQELSHEPVNVFVNLLPSDAGGMTLGLIIFQADDTKCRMLVKRQLHLVEGQRVEDALRTDWRKVMPAPDREDAHDEDRFFRGGLQFFRIVVNAVLYLGSSSPDISGELRAHDLLRDPAELKTSKERRSREYKAKRASQLPYILVGGVVRPMVRPGGQRGTISSVRTLVSGHWKEQPHGEGRKLRKLIHVEPYFRGPEMAELVDRPFLVR